MILSLSGCGDDAEKGEGEAYTGVLSKVRLGMPQSKVLSINNQSEVFYESDDVLWCVNPETDIAEIKEYVPSDSQFFYCDDSIVTYRFVYSEADEEYLLTGFSEESVCLLPRDVAEQYYYEKLKKLAQKYKVSGYQTNKMGTEDVDLEYEMQTQFVLSSFTVDVNMTYTYQTVDNTDGYYCTHFEIVTTSLEDKAAVPVASVSLEGEKGKEAEESEKEAE